ncbi:TetR-like C-terminal domain-containing protein [Paracoccus salsus]|uniref:TetR-like C-terminal domain-containing protein n=1 Tax=Paracoccus salsus TaxID=2911061 RepID=UPI001F46C57D|nr:WHG domain-containing protein [Paracoccus salsus]MCF3974906.1 WHG domain-containing protein [Paracoccus salsus]
MSKHQTIGDGTGLHGRAITTALEMLEESQSRIPQLEDIAQVMDKRLDQITAIFPDSHSLIVAAAEQALVRLMDDCIKAVVKVDPDDAVAQFIALGEAYVQWAVTYRTQFRMMSDDRLIDTLNTPQLRRYLNSLAELMTRMLERARDTGNLSPEENIPLMVLSSRTFAYGLARMLVDRRMSEWWPDMEPMEAARLALNDFVRRTARGSYRRMR